MSYQSNSNAFMNTARARTASVYYDLVGPATAAALGTFTIPDGVSGDIEFEIRGLSSETVSVTMAQGDGNYSANLYPIDESTGLPVSATTLANGRYLLPLLQFGSPKYVKLTKSSTSETAAAALVVPKIVRSL